MSAELADKDATIEANKAEIVDKNSIIAFFMRRIASLEAMPGTAKT